jgi:hypothetical protein
MTADFITCLHEGAHAVVAVLKGMGVKRVLVHRTVRPDGEAGICELADMQDDIATDPWSVVEMTLASDAAERRYAGRASPRGEADRAFARNLIAVTLSQEPGHQDVHTLFEAHERIADGVVANPTTWLVIERVARQLRRYRTLTGADVRAIARDIVQHTKEPA